MKLVVVIGLQILAIDNAVSAFENGNGNHADGTEFDACFILVNQFSSNRTAAHGLQVYYKNEFMPSEINPWNYDLLMALFLNDARSRGPVYVKSVSILIPQYLSFSSSSKETRETESPDMYAFFLNQNLGNTFLCSWPVESLFLLTPLDTDQESTYVIEFAVANLPPNRHLEMYVRFHLQGWEMVHARVELETPPGMEDDDNEMQYPNFSTHGDNLYDEELLGKVVRPRQAESFLNLRRGRPSKKKLSNPMNDPIIRRVIERRVRGWYDADEDDDFPATELKPSRQGMYKVDMTRTSEDKMGRKKSQKSVGRKVQTTGRKAPSNLQVRKVGDGGSVKKTETRKVKGKDGIDQQSTRKSPRMPSGKGDKPSKFVDDDDEDDEYDDHDADDDEDEDEDEKGGKTSSRATGLRTVDAMENAKMKGAYEERQAEEYAIGTPLLYSNCGANYSCFSYPSECNFVQDCYMTVALAQIGSSIHVVLGGATTNWIAVGFSDDDRMGDDAVFVCKRIPGSRRVSIWQAYNRLPSEAYTVGTVIQERQNETTKIAGAIYNGFLTCDMTIPLKFKTDSQASFDFQKSAYHIMLAIGVKTVETKVPGGIQMHDYSAVSAGKILFAGKKTADILTPAKYYAISAHEHLSTLTFGLFMPVGILFGRYGQAGFNGIVFKDFQLWVCVHILIQGLSTFCNIVNMLVIFIGRAGSAYATGSSTYHAVIGIIIFLVCLANPGFGVWIFLNKRNKRPVLGALRWMHWGLGHFGYFLGVIELIRGAYLKKSFVACSFAVIAGYLYLVYVGVNVLLMFNTEHLRMKQHIGDTPIKSFIGPTIQLKEQVSDVEYRERKYMLVFAGIILSICTLFLIIEINISAVGCSILSDDYI